MVEKVGRNDPCACGSGKKYKNCCLLKEMKTKNPLGGRKFTAKVLSAGGVFKAAQKAQEEDSKPVVDYATLMERSFGSALHTHEDKPPVPMNPSDYLVQEETKDDTSK